MVELEQAEAVVGDTESGEDAALVSGPHVRTNGGGNRIAKTAVGSPAL